MRRLLVAAVFVLLGATGVAQNAIASGVAKGNPPLLVQLQGIASEWRDKFKSNNVGCLTIGLSDNEANDEQSEKIEELKADMPAVWNSRPIDRSKRGYHRDNRHLRVLDYADMVDSKKVQEAPKRMTYVGNCGEMAPHLYAYLYRTYKGISVALIQEIGFFADHGYVLVKCDEEIYIVDGWRGLAVGPMHFDSDGVYLLQADGTAHSSYTRGVDPLSSADSVTPGGPGAVWHASAGSQSF